MISCAPKRKRLRDFAKSKRMPSVGKELKRQPRRSAQKRQRKNASAKKRKRSSVRSVSLRLKRPDKGK
jgi:hypothetical protein